ncbi:MAG TPA: methyltransferase domain-containing protein [Dehalococcoidia bacterium]
MAIYDTIGGGYARKRRPDPRWQAVITRALGDAPTVLNVGAGAGSYEPAQRSVVALEPSRLMSGQRPRGAASAVQAVAQALPLRDFSFDAAMAVLTVHHWPDPAQGLAEMRRVARRQVVATWDPAVVGEFWLVRDYLPEIIVRERALPTVRDIAARLEVRQTLVLPVPHDCSDGFMGAYWRRPQAYLDADVRASISALALLEPAVILPAMARLVDDLRSGAWHEKYAHLLELSELDLGYRLIIAGS